MSKISKELIESYRKIVLPFVSNQLCKADFEGQGEIDKAEFEQDFNEILNLAISSLNPSKDAISRSVLKDLISDKSIPIKFEAEKRGEWLCALGMPLGDIYKVIDNAPPVERPKGEWLFKHNSSDIWCSVCDENFDEIPQAFNFCPNCGAEMRTKENENE